jgi:hypothetical protein
MTTRKRSSRRRPAPVFATITDVERLPEWNAAIEQVGERP